MNNALLRAPALLLGFAVLALAGCDAGLTESDAGPSPVSSAVTSDTVVVFVAWGSSNARGRGDSLLSRPVNPDSCEVGRLDNCIAVMWKAGLHGVRPLEDPVLGAATGSAWPQFARSYHQATGHTVFFASAAAGSSRLLCDPETNVTGCWHPEEEDQLYERGLAEIDSAMAAATAAFLPRPVVFGGVLWNQGNDLRDIEASMNTDPTVEDYGNGLADLLEAFQTDVLGPRGGRFYLMQAVASLYDSTPSPTPPYQYYDSPNAASFRATEKSTCLASPACTMAAQQSVLIRNNFNACTTDACRDGLYRPCDAPGRGNCVYPGNDYIHWGQTALDRIGKRTGEIAAGVGF